ncbi:kinase-like domain-containing protein [Gigaspora rosea]|uniref:Kinase-like domain-containing protein n=1 Tax=Gigaspora rosea TaxID=44941 RepID=A0A397W148_9GLOM|nr:kinase-like domain-containing protein [Gigaspora rosea]
MTMSNWFKVAIEQGYIRLFEFNSFENLQIIDRGGFGIVSSAYSKIFDQTVALKSLHNDSLDDDHLNCFIREIRNFTKVNQHHHIIRFFGITQDPKTETYYMVLQFANNGDLRSYLHNHFSELDWPTKIRMAEEISSGVNYLHSSDIVHRDLHDKNLLVHDNRILITDFGLAKSLRNNTMSIIAATCAYSDPLYLQSPYLYKRNKASDIYSLGLIFWELSSGVPPFKNIQDMTGLTLHVVSGKREPPIDGTPIDFINLYTDAWNGDANLRPDINEIRHKLKQIQIESVYHSEQDFNRDNRISNDYTSKSITSIEERFRKLRVVLDNQNSPEELINQGNNYRENNRLEESLADLTKALEIDTNNAFALRSRGTTYGMMKRYKESLDDLNKSLEIDQNNVEALISRGSTYRKMSRYMESLNDFNKILDIYPNNIEALCGRGITYRKMNEYKKSLADLNKLLKIDPKNAKALRNRGETYRMMGKCKESLANFNKSLEIDQNNAFALSSRGETYRKMNKYEESLADFNKSLEIEPKNIFALSGRGETYRMMNNYEKSLANFNESLEIDPDDTFALESRQKIYKIMNKKSKFKKFMQFNRTSI